MEELVVAIFEATNDDGSVKFIKAFTKQLILWHRRLCHPSAERMRWIIQRTTGINFEARLVMSLLYTARNLAKSTKVPLKNAQIRVNGIKMQIWYNLDLIKPTIISGKNYFAFIINDYNCHWNFKALKTKDEIQDVFTKYMDRIIANLAVLLKNHEKIRRRLQVIWIDG
jgi:hypothetical protein